MKESDYKFFMSYEELDGYSKDRNKERINWDRPEFISDLSFVESLNLFYFQDKDKIGKLAPSVLKNEIREKVVFSPYPKHYSFREREEEGFWSVEASPFHDRPKDLIEDMTLELGFHLYNGVQVAWMREDIHLSLPLSFFPFGSFLEIYQTRYHTFVYRIYSPFKKEFRPFMFEECCIEDALNIYQKGDYSFFWSWIEDYKRGITIYKPDKEISHTFVLDENLSDLELAQWAIMKERKEIWDSKKAENLIISLDKYLENSK